MPVTPSSRLSRDAQHLFKLATELGRSGSRIEDHYWEALLGAHLDKILLGKKNRTVENVLELLMKENNHAYELLSEEVETYAESAVFTYKRKKYQALLITAPLLAWTRYQLPKEGQLTKAQLAVFRDAMLTTALAPDVQLLLLPELISFDQMPQSFHETRTWTQQLALKTLDDKHELSFSVPPAPDNEGMLADARFLAGIVVVPEGAPFFRWQTMVNDHKFVSRLDCNQEWYNATNQTVASIFTGCRVEILCPNAFYLNNREADRRIRPMAVQAAVTWLHMAADLSPDTLRATIVACGEQLPEEYRIGFSPRQSNDVIYGAMWPVLSKEEALSESMDTGEASIPEEITALLKELGITEVRRLPGLHKAEFCEDCGAPYFPDPLGELVHPELPDEVEAGPIQLH